MLLRFQSKIKKVNLVLVYITKDHMDLQANSIIIHINEKIPNYAQCCRLQGLHIGD